MTGRSKASSRGGGGTCSSKASSNHSHLDSPLTLTCCSLGKKICLPDPQTLFWLCRITFLIQPRCDVPALPSFLFFLFSLFLFSCYASSHSHLPADPGTRGPDSHLVCLSQSEVLRFEWPQPGGSAVKSAHRRKSPCCHIPAHLLLSLEESSRLVQSGQSSMLTASRVSLRF